MKTQRNLKKTILDLRAEGKSYNEIAKYLHCAKATIAYHCNGTTKEKLQATARDRKKRYNNKKKVKKLLSILEGISNFKNKGVQPDI